MMNAPDQRIKVHSPEDLRRRKGGPVAATVVPAATTSAAGRSSSPGYSRSHSAESAVVTQGRGFPSPISHLTRRDFKKILSDAVIRLA